MRGERIAIVGLGPVGGILAAHLVAAGFNPSLVDICEQHINQIRSDGLIIEGTVSLKVSLTDIYLDANQLVSSQEGFGIIFLCVKSHDIKELCPLLPSLLNPGGIVISCHNGIDTESDLIAAVGETRALRVVVNYAGMVIAPGRIQATFFNPPNYIGAIAGSCSTLARRAREIADTISSVQLETVFSEEIRKQIWEKVILNVVLAPVSALTRMTMAEVLGSQRGRCLVEALLAEAVAVAEGAGYTFGDSFADEVMQYLENAGHHKPSMLCDVLHGRRTEIATQNQMIVEYGREYGIPTPHNEIISNLVACIDDSLSPERALDYRSL